MTDKLLVVVFDQDLPQFKIMCYCLNKNWQGDKSLSIIFQGGIKEQVTEISESFFSKDWQINIIQGEIFIPKLNGYDQQQIQKIIYSINSDAKNVIVFDCKDFLLKPTTSDLFKNGNNHRIPTVADDTFENLYTLTYQAIKSSSSSPNILPNIILTPWIWNVEELKRYWNYVLEKFGNYSNWKLFYPISEIATYYYYVTAIDSNPVVVYDPKQFMPVSGPWGNETNDQLVINMQNFDLFDETVIWKHHRRVTDSNSVISTALQLQKYGVPEKIILDWAKEKHNMLI